MWQEIPYTPENNNDHKGLMNNSELEELLWVLLVIRVLMNPQKKDYDVSTFAATGSTLDLVISTLRVG